LIHFKLRTDTNEAHDYKTLLSDHTTIAMTPHAPTMADQVASSYAESAMLQEHSDTLHRLASDLRAVATRLNKPANELDDLAYCRRRAAFEASRGSLASASKQRTLAKDGKTITERLEEAAEAVRAVQTIKTAAKPLIDGGNAKRQTTIDEFPDKPCTACSQIINPLSPIADRFAERLLQERERQGIDSANMIPRHQKYVGPSGLPLYMGQDGDIEAHYSSNGGTSVTREHWGTVQSSELEMDDVSEANLLRHVKKDNGVRRSLILRAANRLSGDGLRAER
jgi:hypothetical protein